MRLKGAGFRTESAIAKELKVTERLDDVGCKSRADDGGCNW